MGQMAERNKQILMIMQEKLASLFEFAEKVNIIMEECIEAETANDHETERRLVEEIDKLDEELDNILMTVSQAEIDEITHVLDEDALLANADWLKESSRKLSDLAERYTEAIRQRHDVKTTVEIRQEIKLLGHALVRGRK